MAGDTSRLVRFANFAREACSLRSPRGGWIASFLTPHCSHRHGTPCLYNLTPHSYALPPRTGQPQGLPLRPHSYALTPHSYGLTPLPSLLSSHSSLLRPHSSLLTPHSYGLTPHSSLLTPHSYDLTPPHPPQTSQVCAIAFGWPGHAGGRRGWWLLAHWLFPAGASR